MRFFSKLIFMGKKKNLKESVSELEMEFIEQKMKGDCALNYLTSEGLCSKLKTLGYKIDIKCKNEKQKEFLKLLKNKNYQICFGVGSPGTGKSYLSLAYALKELKDGNYSNIIMMIPTAPAGGLDLNLGYLKGDLETKIQPYLECDEQTITKMQQVRRAALAPAEPSSQDYSVARKAQQKEMEARAELNSSKAEKADEDENPSEQSKNAADETTNKKAIKPTEETGSLASKFRKVISSHYNNSWNAKESSVQVFA